MDFGFAGSRESAAARQTRNRFNGVTKRDPVAGGVIESGLRSMKPTDAPPFEDAAPLLSGAGLERGWYLWLTAATMGSVAIAGLAGAFAGVL